MANVNYWGTGTRGYGPVGVDRPIPPAFGPGGVIPFDQRGLPTPGTPVPPTPGAGPFPKLPDYSQISDIIGQINATNQAAQTSALNARIPGGPALEQQSSQFIQNLFSDANDPNKVFLEADVPNAAYGVGSGTVGSPFAGSVGMLRTERERIDRGERAQRGLTGALARNPAAPIADPSRLVEMGAGQAFTAEQSALDRAQRERMFNAEMANRALNLRNYGRGGGGGGYGPNVPTDYGRPGTPDSTTYGPGIPPGPRPPTPPPYVGPGGVPNIGRLENWAEFDPGTQRAFNEAFRSNPYFGMPDYENPYSGDLPPAAPLPPLPNLVGGPQNLDDFLFNYT